MLQQRHGGGVGCGPALAQVCGATCRQVVAHDVKMIGAGALGAEHLEQRLAMVDLLGKAGLGALPGLEFTPERVQPCVQIFGEPREKPCGGGLFGPRLARVGQMDRMVAGVDLYQVMQQ